MHDHWEEVYVVQGDLVVGNDKQGKGGQQCFAATYACRPPGAAPRPVHLPRRLHPPRDPLLRLLLRPALSTSNRSATAASSTSARSASTTSPRIPRSATPRSSIAAIYDMKRADPSLVRGEGGAVQQLLPESEDARGSGQANRAPPRDRAHEPRPARPLARPRVELRHRHGDEPVGVRQVCRRICIALLREHAPRGPLRRVRRAAAAGGAESRVLPEARTCRCRRCAWCARTTTAWSSRA